ncbi:hypothetical protein ACHAWF_015862 [Thalassiosira exigua]
MFCVLLIFVVLMISTNFVLVKWHANLFIGLYFLYIAYAIGSSISGISRVWIVPGMVNEQAVGELDGSSLDEGTKVGSPLG